MEDNGSDRHRDLARLATSNTEENVTGEFDEVEEFGPESEGEPLLTRWFGAFESYQGVGRRWPSWIESLEQRPPYTVAQVDDEIESEFQQMLDSLMPRPQTETERVARFRRLVELTLRTMPDPHRTPRMQYHMVSNLRLNRTLHQRRSRLWSSRGFDFAEARKLVQHGFGAYPTEDEKPSRWQRVRTWIQRRLGR